MFKLPRHLVPLLLLIGVILSGHFFYRKFSPRKVVSPTDPIGFTADRDSIGFMSDHEQVATARYFLMGNETEEIICTYYIWEGDRIGGAALSMLREAARRGRRVRIIFDGFSTIQFQSAPDIVKKSLAAFTPGYPISHEMIKALMDDGVEVKIFNPVRTGNLRRLLPPNFNTRSHNKLTYLKSQRAVLLGDRNWQGVNFRMIKGSEKNYRSVEAVYQGPAAEDVGAYLNDLWDNKEWVMEPRLRENLDQKMVEFERSRLSKFYSLVEKKMRAFTPNLIRSEMNPVSLTSIVEMNEVNQIQFLADPVGRKRLDPGMEVDLYRLLNSAKQKITIVSPYIVFTKNFKELIRRKAVQEGVEVTVLTPGIETTDSPISSLALSAQAKELMSWGVKIFQHQGPDFLHAKMVLVDGDQTLITAHNLDLFSEYFNYESGVLVTDASYHEKVASFVKDLIEKESLPFKAPSAGPMMRCMGWLMKLVSERFPLPKLDPVLNAL
jgi:phosphatidylserine/phosphatidylglycerophosphate/cardiolipin synthase-like enzyme